MSQFFSGGWGDRLELRQTMTICNGKEGNRYGHGEQRVGRIATGGKNVIDKGSGKVWENERKNGG